VVSSSDRAAGTVQWRDQRDGRVLAVPACIAELEAQR
jgi:hypothetical protein